MNAKTMMQLAGMLGPAAKSPVVRLGMRYWPVAGLMGYALWNRYKERKSKDEATVYNMLADAGSVIGPWTALIAISEFAAKKERQEAQVNPVERPAAPAKSLLQAPNLPVANKG